MSDTKKLIESIQNNLNEKLEESYKIIIPNILNKEFNSASDAASFISNFAIAINKIKFNDAPDIKLIFKEISESLNFITTQINDGFEDTVINNKIAFIFEPIIDYNWLNKYFEEAAEKVLKNIIQDKDNDLNKSNFDENDILNIVSDSIYNAYHDMDEDEIENTYINKDIIEDWLNEEFPIIYNELKDKYENKDDLAYEICSKFWTTR